MGDNNMATYQFSNAELLLLKGLLIHVTNTSYELRGIAEQKIDKINQILAARNTRG